MTPGNLLTIGTIGAGQVGQAIARAAVDAGHRVVLSNSRGPESLGAVVGGLGDNASAATPAQAAQADVVILAAGWDQVPDAVRDLPDWGGRIVIDTTNQWHQHDPSQPADLGDETGSEYISALLPGARVVKAFNTVRATVVTRSLDAGGAPLVIFLAGDDTDAKAVVSGFIASLGLAAIDLGDLRPGGKLMQAGGPLVDLHLAKIH